MVLIIKNMLGFLMVCENNICIVSRVRKVTAFIVIAALFSLANDYLRMDGRDELNSVRIEESHFCLGSQTSYERYHNFYWMAECETHPGKPRAVPSRLDLPYQ